VDLIEDNIDVALRVRNSIDNSANLVVRQLAVSQVIPGGQPRLHAPAPHATYPGRSGGSAALTMSRADGRGQWQLLDQAGHSYSLQIDQPRLMTDDLLVLLEAAMAGLGVAALPVMVCDEAIQQGRLLRLRRNSTA
jgi:DNA-binding transcriptional LysR family regulator